MRPLLIIDDACGLCQAWAAWIQQRGGAVQVVGSSSLRGQRWLRRVGEGHVTASSCVSHAIVPRALVLVADGRCHRGSTAALQVFRYVRQPWPFLALGLAVPVMVRDALYEQVARRRLAISRWLPRGVRHQA